VRVGNAIVVLKCGWKQLEPQMFSRIYTLIKVKRKDQTTNTRVVSIDVSSTMESPNLLCSLTWKWTKLSVVQVEELHGSSAVSSSTFFTADPAP
jgi:hypothetical protein